MFSIEGRLWDGHSTSVSATVGRMLGHTQGASGQVGMRAGDFRDDLKEAPLQRHFLVRNAPYAVKDRGNPLISQQMRAPSERTKRATN
jgi:hypothetical protein